MTARIAITCDGTFDIGRMPCRGTYPLPAARYATLASGGDLTDLYAARIEAYTHGWSEEAGRDYCPAHTHRRRAEELRALAVRLSFPRIDLDTLLPFTDG